MQTMFLCALIGAVLALPTAVTFGIPHPNGETMLVGAAVGVIVGGFVRYSLMGSPQSR